MSVSNAFLYPIQSSLISREVLWKKHTSPTTVDDTTCPKALSLTYPIRKICNPSNSVLWVLDTDTETTEADVPRPTSAGGFTHTEASRAKISAANKGKTPWNKGKARSDEVRARIAQGVRRKNRERFLQKIADLGLTEEEYKAQKKEERRQKDAERRARRTPNGGYRPTEETKAKISSVLKEKYSKGEIKRRKPSTVRKGFKHSKETKAKISESLKKKWAEDADYQERMKGVISDKSDGGIKQKISKTLKKRWEDPEFRERMMKAMKKRNMSVSTSKTQRQKISEAIKKKWQDEEYRQRAMKGMEVSREKRSPIKKKKTPKKPTVKKDAVTAVKPVTKKKIKRKTKTKRLKSQTLSQAGSVAKKMSSTSVKKTSRKTTIKKKAPNPSVVMVESVSVSDEKKDPVPKKKEKKKDGDISRMREERRDLYDLLYGDEAASSKDNELVMNGSGKLLADDDQGSSMLLEKPTSLSFFSDSAALDDEDLNDYDPYGLDD